MIQERDSVMEIPKYYEMHKPLLLALQDGQQHSIKELKEYVRTYFGLSVEDVSILLPSGRQSVFLNRLGWARTYLKKAGLIVSPTKGQFQITVEGKNALMQNPTVIDTEFLKQFPSFCDFINQPSASRTKEEDSIEQTPDDEFEDAFRKINNSLADDLLSEVMQLSPTSFEKMVLDLLAAMGYGTFENAASTTVATGDEGIDGIVMEDKLGFDKIFVQVKHWNSDHLVGRPDIQAFVGAIAGKGGKGLFVTTSSFSRLATDYARNQHIVLIDGQKLANLMIEHNFGVTVKKIFQIKALDTDIFEEYQES